MKILYIGDTFQHSTSAHRANALRRLGHEVMHIHPRGELPRSRIVGGISVRFGLGLFAPLVMRSVKRSVGNQCFDLAWVDCGAELGLGVYHYLHSKGMKIINYNVDDPFGSRDGRKWNLYRKSVPQQDLTVVVREENVAEAKAAGARKVLRVYRSYDPVAHLPVELTSADQQKWSSEVSFIGTWMPERGAFLVRLLQLGVPLTIRGGLWNKASEWEQLKSAWRGPDIYGRDFVIATQTSKIAIGMLSKGNRDRHTTRTAEIPYIGGSVFCAERTDEHELLYKDGEMAVFWKDAEECAVLCRRLLGNEASRMEMTKSARARVLNLCLSNDKVVKKILDSLDNEGPVNQIP